LTQAQAEQSGSVSAPSATGSEPIDGPRAERTRTRHTEIHTLVTQGMTVTQIGRTLNLDRKTVQ